MTSFEENSRRGNPRDLGGVRRGSMLNEPTRRPASFPREGGETVREASEQRSSSRPEEEGERMRMPSLLLFVALFVLVVLFAFALVRKQAERRDVASKFGSGHKQTDGVRLDPAPSGKPNVESTTPAACELCDRDEMEARDARTTVHMRGK